MALFWSIDKTGSLADGASAPEMKLEVGKTLAVLLIGLACLGAALWLYLVDKSTAAGTFFALGEAVVVGGLGIAVGEHSGAAEAAKKPS